MASAAIHVGSRLARQFTIILCRIEALKQGVEFKLVDAESELEETYQKAPEDTSPQLVAINDKIAQHARWKASKLNRETHSEKT